MDEFRKMVNGHDTLTLRRDRFLTSGFSVVRRAKSTLRSHAAARVSLTSQSCPAG